jgi:hypothetical protein
VNDELGLSNHCGFGIWDFGKKGLSIGPVRSFKFCFKNKIAVVATLAVAQLNMATARIATTAKMLTIRTLLNKIKSFVHY